MNCRFCNLELPAFLSDQGLDVHPKCEQEQGAELVARNAELKTQLMEIIVWADNNSPRSQQIAIGPSEIGQECDMRVARTLAGMPQVNNRFDPWAGIVGTSIHSWMQNAVDRYLTDNAVTTELAGWLTEVRVHADELISGSSDLYANGDVVDYKSASSDKIKTYREKGKEALPVHYIVQAHIYGLGQLKAGRTVRDVVLVFLPRNGLIKDMYIWREPFDENVALYAILRMYGLADQLIEAGLPESGDWSTIALTPTTDCWYCPFFVDRPVEQGPDAIGCPGNSKTQEERLQRASDKFDQGFL